MSQIVVDTKLEQRQVKGPAQGCTLLHGDHLEAVRHLHGAGKQKIAEPSPQAGQHITCLSAAIHQDGAAMQPLKFQEEGRPRIDHGSSRAHREQVEADLSLDRRHRRQMAAVMDRDRQPAQRARAATPGSSLPSMNSRKAPPAVDT